MHPCKDALGYHSCKADLDLCVKPETRPDDGFDYKLFILCNVNDILCIHHSLENVLKKLNGYISLKPGSVGSTDMYLGKAKVNIAT